jgi:hypothetical protein
MSIRSPLDSSEKRRFSDEATRDRHAARRSHDYTSERGDFQGSRVAAERVNVRG